MSASAIARMTERIHEHPAPPLVRLQRQGFRLVVKPRVDLSVSVTTQGIGISHRAVAALGSPTHCYVLVRADALAVIPAAVDAPDAYRLSQPKDSSNGLVVASTVVRALRAEGWEPGKYGARLDDGALLCERETT